MDYLVPRFCMVQVRCCLVSSRIDCIGIRTHDEDEDSQPAGLCPNTLAWSTRCFSLWNGGIVFQNCQKTRQVRMEKTGWGLKAQSTKGLT